MAEILLFHVSEDKRIKIEKLCKEEGIRVILVDKEEYGETLGSLGGIQGFRKNGKPYQGKELPSDMMVFSGMESGKLDIFLQKYKAAQIAPIPLKAMITMYNVNWDAKKLYEELCEEHQALN